MPFLGGVFLSLNVVVSALTVTVPVQPSPQDIWVAQLHQCENPDNVVSVMDINHKRSFGYVMFQMDTWLSFGKPFGATRENISDDDLQTIVAEDMLNKGLWRHWFTCSKRTTKLLGEYPAS